MTEFLVQIAAIVVSLFLWIGLVAVWHYLFPPQHDEPQIDGLP